jgi:hypothetical protein
MMFLIYLQLPKLIISALTMAVASKPMAHAVAEERCAA